MEVRGGWQGGPLEANSRAVQAVDSSACSGSAVPQLQRTCHLCRTMAAQLGTGLRVLKQPRNSVHSGASRTLGQPCQWQEDREVGSQSLGRSAVSEPRWGVSSGSPRTLL